jgi:hypothetical protein
MTDETSIAGFLPPEPTVSRSTDGALAAIRIDGSE